MISLDQVRLKKTFLSSASKFCLRIFDGRIRGKSQLKFEIWEDWSENRRRLTSAALVSADVTPRNICTPRLHSLNLRSWRGRKIS